MSIITQLYAVLARHRSGSRGMGDRGFKSVSLHRRVVQTQSLQQISAASQSCQADREARRDWRLTLLPEGGTRNPPLEKSCPRRWSGLPKQPRLRESPASSRYRIKRVPVVRDDRIVGIVSRADLLRALQRVLGAALRGISPSGRGWSGRLLARSMPALVTRTLERCCCRGRDAAYGRGNWPNGDRFWHAGCRFRSSRCRASGGGSLVTRRSNVHHGVKELIDHHVADKSWRSILHHAREASFPPCWRRGDRASPGTRLPHRDPEPAYPGRLSSRSPHRLNGQVVHPSDVVRAGR